MSLSRNLSRNGWRTLTLALGVLVLALLARLMAQSAPPLESVDALVVVDANGKKVGRMLDTSGDKPWVDVAVTLGTSHHFFKLTVSKDQISGIGAFSFESNDCSGTPYLSFSVSAGSPLEDVVVAPPGHTLYVPDANAPP